jgi:cytochrome c oxidase cbb3-type subunit III
MPTKVEKDAVTGTNTTGHEWDGIRELDTPLPRWWLNVFYVTIAFSVLWMVLYPSLPWVDTHFKGLLGQTNRSDVAEELALVPPGQAAYRSRIAEASLEEIRRDADLAAFAMIGGRAAFAENCAACHRPGGAGSKGFPNLADDDWLWGGSLADIHRTIAYGIRNANGESRQSQMPKFDGVLTAAQIGDVTDFVLSLNDKPASAAAVERGRKVFAEACITCHGESAKGNRELGAPKLERHIFVFGGDRAAVVQTIAGGRNGSMPAWNERLDAATVKMLAVYVHALGGGE